ncbi:CHAD domain-containing protein [Stella humosa]|uniref:CHAD domain-containing protein n=1 Tax=Stella humosa TaxID=94 RepID=A0A3N1MD08_9PROT|nr:CHAD domain-containing protein [Stella humosa]ROQ01611.1 CHAD domain-containing protein [Stella humosa]BBK31992.1 hypothetical protein STHU_26260 [Stella humosa]
MPAARFRLVLAADGRRGGGRPVTLTALRGAVDATGPPPSPWVGYRRQPGESETSETATGRRRTFGEDATVAVETATWRLAGAEWRQRRIVLEGKVGSDSRLVTCAEALARSLPLRLTVDEAAAWRLAPDRPDAVRVVADDPGSAETAGAAFRLVGRAALRQVLGNLELASIANAPETIHQLRVGLRRLRAALQLFSDCLDEPARRAMGARLKAIDGPFAHLRDLDAFIDETLLPAVDATGSSDLAALLATARQARESADAGIAQALHDPQLNLAMLALVDWLEFGTAPCDGRGADQPVERFARRVLRRRRRQLFRSFDAAPPRTAEDWHRVRILAKKLRYATDAFAPLYARATTRPFRRALQEVQDSLGRYNDAAVADRLAAGLGQPTAAAMVAGWTARQRVEQVRRFGRAWKSLRKCPTFWQRD